MRKTTVKLLYGEAFRAPNAYELFWRQVGVTKANPLLQPETNKTGEVVLERYFGNHFRVASTAFYYDINGLISQETDPADDLLVYNNIDEVRGKGLELEAEGKWPSGLQGRLSYTLQNSRNEHTRMALTNSPKQLAQFNLMTPLLHNGIAAGLELQIDRQETDAGRHRGRTSPRSQPDYRQPEAAARNRALGQPLQHHRITHTATPGPRSIARTRSCKTAARSASS